MIESAKGTPRGAAASLESPRWLGSLSIDVVVDNPNVGEDLQHHPMSLMSFEAVDDGEEGLETIDAIARQDPNAISAAIDAYTTRKRGPFSHTNSTPWRTSLSPASTPKPVDMTYRSSSKVSHQSSQPSQQANETASTSTDDAAAILSSTTTSGYYVPIPCYARPGP